MKVAIVDRTGVLRFRTAEGGPWLDPEDHEVDLLTDLHRLSEVRIDEYVSVLGYPIDDEERTEATLDTLASTRGLDAIVVFPENLQLAGARVRSKHGLNGHGEDWVEQFRDKHLMKLQARRAGLRCADSTPVGSIEDVESMLTRHGRVVVKPRDGAGSAGISVISTRGELESLAWPLENHQVESFVEGDLLHVDVIVFDREVVLRVVSRYLDSTLSHVEGIPLGSVVTRDPEILAAADDMLASLIDCLSIDRAVLHLEAFLVDGELVFSEVACRAGGGLIPETVMAQEGYNIMGAMIDLELGVRPTRSARQTPRGTMHGFVLFYAGAGTFGGIDSSAVPEDWIVYRKVAAKAGARVTPVGRAGGSICGFVVQGADEREVTERIRQMQRDVVVRMAVSP